MEDSNTIKNIFNDKVEIIWNENQTVTLNFAFDDEEAVVIQSGEYFAEDLKKEQFEWLVSLTDQINEMCVNNYEFYKLITNDGEGFRILSLTLKVEKESEF